MKTTNSKLAAIFCFIMVQTGLFAQHTDDVQKALSLVQKNAAIIGLSADNIFNSRISDTYEDVLSGSTLVYLQQTYIGYDVDKSIQVFAFKNGILVSSAGQWIETGFAKKNNNAFSTLQKKLATPVISIEDAIRAAAKHLQLPAPAINSTFAVHDFSKRIDFGDLGIAKQNVNSRLLWIPQKSSERIKLAWEVIISPKATSDHWRVIVDAGNGTVIKKENYTIYDNWDKTGNRNKQPEHSNKTDEPLLTTDSLKKQPVKNITSATYRVVQFPAEAPSFPKGNPYLVTDPWKLSPKGSGATPFIWNDDGRKQYKSARGNNVYVEPHIIIIDSITMFQKDSIEKGVKGIVCNNHLYFDFKPDFVESPTDSINRNFALTNLFYWNNIIHDLSYQYGFDEVSGNFQQNNLGRGGKGKDLVEVYRYENIGNNASFGTSDDGVPGFMVMWLFDGDPLKRMTINFPESIAGDVIAVEGVLSNSNRLESIGAITGDLVLYEEATDTLHIGCDPSSNASALTGKIALINRGSCDFVAKIFNAQNAGAIAVVMVDNIPGEWPFTMGGYDPAIVIPAVMISYEDGIKIRGALNSGVGVNVTLKNPIATDGSLDNGIICHEYGHGISNRLTGGPSNSACLYNAEQMGEGWSDYVALMTTTDWKIAQVSDGHKAKGVGTYALNQPTNGLGIRTYPYSVDMNVNPQTYADIASTLGEPHYVGEIWTSALWDMTWLIIQDEGINKNIFNAQGKGGNTIAYKLVMEGMKLQPCSPGFIDGRNAILKADSLLYNGRHICAIRKAFARRGMGVGASQGSSDIIGDEIVDFAESGLSIAKYAPQSIKGGKDMQYTIKLKKIAPCNGIVKQLYSVTDSLPGNVNYVSSDGYYNPSNKTVSFNNIDIGDADSLIYHIKVNVNKDAAFSDSVYLNDSIPEPVISDKWVAKNGKKLEWSIDPFFVPTYYYWSNDDSVKDAESLVTSEKYLIPGQTTTFSFLHYMLSYDLKNGGVVEITSDGGKTWEDLGPYMSGFVYNDMITGNSVLNGRMAFTHNTAIDFQTTNIDLSAFAGKKIKIRFLYATSDGSAGVPGYSGWDIGNIVLSASPSITNTAKLFNKNGFLASSTAVTKIKNEKVTTDFVAVKYNNSKAHLMWKQSGELNGTFQVERSTDNGVSFTTIGKVSTIKSNADLQDYSFTDPAPIAGTNLYRLTYKNAKGIVEHSQVRLLTFKNMETEIIFPNPARNKLNVSIPGNDKTVTFELTDGTGKVVKSYKAGGQNILLNLPPIAAGIYYLKLIKEDGTESIHKVVIE
ncbi:hypothetical protein BH10BAC2_BH10BAC2_03560 [soil metagenome]